MTTKKRPVFDDKVFTSIFWQLGTANSAERERASLELQHVLSSESSKSSPAKNTVEQQPHDATVSAASKLQYSLERLHKGLAASKPEAKLGFSLALTMLLEKLHKRQVRAAFEVAQKCLIDMKTETKQEVSCRKVGLCFLLLALTRSGAFAKLKTSQKSALLDQILPLLDDKALVDSASMALSSSVEQLTTEEFGSCLFDKLSDRLSRGWESLDVNGLLLLLCCHRHHKETLGRSFLKAQYGTKHLISEENFAHFQRICLASGESRETMSSARLHPGVEQLLDCLLVRSGRLLAQFVAATAAAAAVAAGADAPAGRKAVAFNLIGWIADCPEEKFTVSSSASASPDADKVACLSECLASPDVCRQLRLHAASQSSVLHAFARQLLGNRLLATAPAAAFTSVAGRLLAADCLFDSGLPPECRILVGDRLQRLPIDLLDDCAQRIESTIADNCEGSSSSGSEAAKRSAATAFAMQCLRQLAACRAVLSGRPKSSARMLLCLADRFLVSPQEADNASDGARQQQARSAFCRALDSMSASTGLPGYRRCLRLLAKGLTHRLSQLGSDDSAAPFSANRCLQRGLELLSASASTADEDAAEAAVVGIRGLDWCFALAYLHLGFHLLTGGAGDSADGAGDGDNGDKAFSEADAEALIADLDECRRRSVDGDRSGGGDGKPKWSDVLLDSFLGLLIASRSRLLRSIAGQVARQVAPLVTLEGVAALTQTLLEGDGDVGVEESDGDESDEGENGDAAAGGDVSDKESEVSIGDESTSEESTGSVDPEFRRACKSALGEAACPSDVEDADPSDLSDSAMDRVDEALSLAFRSSLGPRKRAGGSRAAALLRRRRQCQARLRALDVAEALLDGGVGAGCRAALAAGLGRLALLAAGAVGVADSGGGSGKFWSAAPAAEREQLRQRAVALLKRTATTAATAAAAAESDAADAEICRTAVAALAANMRSPLPTKIAQTATETLSALLRVRPAPVEATLADALARHLSATAATRSRIGGLAMWQRVCTERPGLLRGLRGRLLELLLAATSTTEGEAAAAATGGGSSGLRPFDRAEIISLAECLARGDARESDTNGDGDGDFYRQLADWTFARLSAEAAGVTSARLLAALLSLAAALLKLRCRRPSLGVPEPPAAGDLAERLRVMLAGSRNRDLRRGLHVCLTALGDSQGRGGVSRAVKRQAKREKRRMMKRMKLEKPASEKMELD